MNTGETHYKKRHHLKNRRAILKRKDASQEIIKMVDRPDIDIRKNILKMCLSPFPAIFIFLL